MPSILLLTATTGEQRQLTEQLTEAVIFEVAGKPVSRGQLCGKAVWAVETGIGSVNTAHALTCQLQAQRPARVLQVGVGGAYPESGLSIGDLAVASEENYGDIGVRTESGWEPADLIGIPLAARGEEHCYNRFALDEHLVGRAAELLAAASWRQSAPALATGPFVTVQECSGTARLGAERAGLFPGAVCENMEGAAAAHICYLYALPFIEVRAVSNLVEDRHEASWDLPLASARAQEAALCLIAGLAL